MTEALETTPLSTSGTEFVAFRAIVWTTVAVESTEPVPFVPAKAVTVNVSEPIGATTLMVQNVPATLDVQPGDVGVMFATASGDD